MIVFGAILLVGISFVPLVILTGEYFFLFPNCILWISLRESLILHRSIFFLTSFSVLLSWKLAWIGCTIHDGNIKLPKIYPLNLSLRKSNSSSVYLFFSFFTVLLSWKLARIGCMIHDGNIKVLSYHILSCSQSESSIDFSYFAKRKLV